MKKPILIALLITFSLFLNAQIINKGTLKIIDGTTVYFGEVYTNDASATHDNEGNLHLNSDFINNGTITASANADTANGITYFDSPTNVNAATNNIQHILGTNKVIFENLEINMTGTNAKGVLVADNMELIVENSINLVNKDLRLENKAQLIQLHTGTNANLGNSNLLRDQQGTT
ncbi:MAG TPA: ABC transporter permease, partial [Flavobacteriia bacterium]|nr:ABC transporter permease [Flavobacteriia bacterium]